MSKPLDQMTTQELKLPVIPSIQRGTPDQLPGHWVPGSWQLSQLNL